MRVSGWAIAGAVTVIAGAATAFAFRPANAGAPAFWLSLCGAGAVLAAGGTLACAKLGDWRWILPRWGDITKGAFAAGLLFGLAFVFVRLALTGTPREAWLERVYAQLGEPAALREAYGRTIALVAGVAVLEEIVWRGVVTSALEPEVGSRRAWVVSALLYALAHLPVAWVLGSPLLPLAALVLGLSLGALARASGGRVPPAMVAHALFDVFAALMFRLVGTSV